VKCPYCGLFNPDNAHFCDCGYDFQAGAQSPVYRRLVQQKKRQDGIRTMLIGGLVCMAGIVVTAGSLLLAAQAGGGLYLIAFGAIVGGAIQFSRGLAFWTRP